MNKQKFQLIERWARGTVVFFFLASNACVLLISIFAKPMRGYIFLLTLLSIVPYILYLKYVRGTLEKSVVDE